MTGNRISGRTIEVLVGDKDELFSVHQSLIRTSSSFFEKALGGKWKESVQRTVKLPDDDPDIFATYIHWIYFGTVHTVTELTAKPAEDSEITSLVKAYIMGDKLLDPTFQIATINAISMRIEFKAENDDLCKKLQDAITYAYSNTCESSPIRQVLVNIFANCGESGWLSGWTPPVPFFPDLTYALLKVREVLQTSTDTKTYKRPKRK